ncbi:MAG: intradiol ring-cleavage dioxygenase [Ktedonobacterales bacterium]
MATQRNLDETTITGAVIDQFAGTPSPRLKHIMTSLVRHLHDFAREVNLTEDEWFQGIDFLTRTGHTCSDTRQEFILLSDALGLSQLVVAQNHKRAPEATEQTVFGPFHIEGATPQPDGANIAEGVSGDPLFVTAQVTGIDAKPIASATVDVWHADAEGFYDLQDPNWSPDEMKLRAVFQTNADGRFSFRTIQPSAYPIPTDGPVGEMLHATNRSAMRPAHVHFRVSAPGYDTLITHIFVAGDRWLESDAVFGVRSSCIADFTRHEASETAPDGSKPSQPFYTLDYTFRLQPI